MFVNPNDTRRTEELALSLEKPQKQPWWDRKAFIAAFVFSAVWLAFIWDYLFSSGWWNTRHELSPAEFVGSLCGLFLPIILAFLISAYFDRASQLTFEAQTVRSYLGELIFPANSNAVYTRTLTGALREQVQAFRQLYTDVGLQTKTLQGELQQWSEDMTHTISQLNLNTTNGIREISQGIERLAQETETASQHASASAAQFDEQARSVQAVIQNALQQFTPVLDALNGYVTQIQQAQNSLSSVDEDIQGTITLAQNAADQLNRQVKSIEDTVYACEETLSGKEKVIDEHLERARQAFALQNELLGKSETFLTKHNDLIQQAQNVVQSHNNTLMQSENIARMQRDVLEKTVTATTKQVQQMEANFQSGVTGILRYTDDAIGKLTQMEASLDETVQKAEKLQAIHQRIMGEAEREIVVSAASTGATEDAGTVQTVEAPQTPKTIQIEPDFLQDATAILDQLQTFSIDMAHIFTPKSEETLWKKYYEGDKAVFMRHITRMISESQHKQILELYQTNTDFNQAVSRYMSGFESMTQMVQTTDQNKLLMSILIGSDIGRLYMVLADVLKRKEA